MIRKANVSDAKSIAHIRVDGWKTAYNNLIPNSFLNTLDYNVEEERVSNRINGNDDEFTSDILVYEEDDEVLAYAYYGKALDNLYPQYQGEVVALYVRPDMKNRGIGTKLMDEIKELLKKQGYSNMVVWCLKENHPSIGFYKHMGGTVKEERKFEIDGIKVWGLGIAYEL